MIDLSATILAKSDQLNADDLIAGPKTVTVTKVTAAASAEQPVRIFYEGDNGKPFIPCKTMRRLLIHVWGADGEQYTGRRMTLYRDADVRYGGEAVGGIRISHVSHISGPISVALTVTRGKKKLVTVNPLATQGVGNIDADALYTEGADVAARGMDALSAWFTGLSKDKKATAAGFKETLKAIAADADANSQKEANNETTI